MIVALEDELGVRLDLDRVLNLHLFQQLLQVGYSNQMDINTYFLNE